MKNRYFQFLRGILIICVVLIHVMYEVDNSKINYYNIVIRNLINFCVAIFIFISGHFTKYEKVNKNPKRYIYIW